MRIRTNLYSSVNGDLAEAVKDFRQINALNELRGDIAKYKLATSIGVPIIGATGGGLLGNQASKLWTKKLRARISYLKSKSILNTTESRELKSLESKLNSIKFKSATGGAILGGAISHGIFSKVKKSARKEAMKRVFNTIVSKEDLK